MGDESRVFCHITTVLLQHRFKVQTSPCFTLILLYLRVVVISHWPMMDDLRFVFVVHELTAVDATIILLLCSGSGMQVLCLTAFLFVKGIRVCWAARQAERLLHQYV